MNHDVAHCLDYKSGKCPNTCPFAKLEQDLQKHAIDLIGVPITYQSFLHDSICERSTRKE